MTDLFDLTLRTAIELGVVRQGVATGGATNTLIDTVTFANIDDDYFNEGTVWITGTTDNLSPLEDVRTVTDFANTTSTVTVSAAFSANPGAGDRYAISNRRYRLYELKQQINNALINDGYIAEHDRSLTTVANQREYSLPAGTSMDLRQVFLDTSLDSGRGIPTELKNWSIRRADTGGTDTLILDRDYTAGYPIELIYGTQHAELVDLDDVLNQAVHPDRLIYRAAAECMKNFADRTRLKHLDDTIQRLSDRADRAERVHPLPPIPSRPSKILVLNKNWRNSQW